VSELKKLRVIEVPYCYNKWRVDPNCEPYKITAEIKRFIGPRDVDLYHKENLYSKANVPYAVDEIDHNDRNEMNPCFSLCRSISDIVCNSNENGESVLIANGYCLFAPAIAGGVQRAAGENKTIGVVWIDAHADNMVIEESMEETRFVGLPVSGMLGQTYEYWRKDICGLKKPIEGAHLLIGDTRANEGEMDHTMEKAGVIHVSHDQFACCNIWQKKVNDFAKDVDAIYLSVDVDILNKKYIPAYEKEVENGHDIETVMQNIHAVMNTGKVNAFSMFCLDFDHYEHGGKETYRNGMKLISSGLEAWKNTAL
jgi:Arginase/agmatinase/formimionoglutamate hydrolase, arginase family